MYSWHLQFYGNLVFLCGTLIFCFRYPARQRIYKLSDELVDARRVTAKAENRVERIIKRQTKCLKAVGYKKGVLNWFRENAEYLAREPQERLLAMELCRQSFKRWLDASGESFSVTQKAWQDLEEEERKADQAKTAFRRAILRYNRLRSRITDVSFIPPLFC